MRYLIFSSFDLLQRNQSDETICIWVPNDSGVSDTLAYLTQRLTGEISIEDNLLAKHASPDHLTDLKVVHSEARGLQESKLSKIAFFASNDPIAKLQLPIITKLIQRVETRLYTPRYKNERAQEVFTDAGYKSAQWTLWDLCFQRPEVLVLSNDWGSEECLLILLCRWLRIKTVCIQESIIDFNPAEHRMAAADFVCIQGAVTSFELKRRLFFITGNPRYEQLTFLPLPAVPKLMINCNFTYGIFEDYRNEWLDQIIAVAEALPVDYFISQHPRDTGDLQGYKNCIRSNAAEVHAQIASASIVITRFSSLVHEALLMGRKVIYFNPHGEKMHYDFTFDKDHVILATNSTKLTLALNSLLKDKSLSTEDRFIATETFVDCHCLQMCRNSTYNIQLVIDNINKLTIRSNGIRSKSDLLFFVVKFIARNIRNFIWSLK